MSENSFKKEISKLEPRESSKEYDAIILETSSDSGSVENFKVFVWRQPKVRGSFYQFQWKRNDEPELPKLNWNTEQKARKAFQNMAYFTAGYGNNSERNADLTGMKDIETVVKAVNDFRKLGIIINI